MNSYKVTAVPDASIAACMLYEGSMKFDIVMIDVNTFEMETHKLVDEVIKMDIISILMSDTVSFPLTKSAIEDGLYLFLQKPVGNDVLKYLGQHVLREKMLKIKEKETFKEVVNSNNAPTNNQPMAGNLEYGAAGQKGNMIEEITNAGLGNAMRITKSNICAEWTPELHKKFMDAVNFLGEGWCFPKEILEQMNTPGLTRMQVAHHLQKCRLGWQSPQGRKPHCRGAGPSSSTVGSNSRTNTYELFMQQPKVHTPN